MRQLILTTDKKTDGSIIYTLIEVEQTEGNYIRFPWNAQSINQAVLDLLVKAITHVPRFARSPKNGELNQPKLT